MAPRRQYQGVTDVKLPIADIMLVVDEWTGEIVDAIAAAAVQEIRKNAASSFGTKTGNLKRSIRRKRSKYDNKAAIAGAFAPHAHLLENGHLKVLWGKRTGEHVPGTYFVARAQAAVEARAQEIAQSVIAGKGLVIG